MLGYKERHVWTQRETEKKVRERFWESKQQINIKRCSTKKWDYWLRDDDSVICLNGATERQIRKKHKEKEK